MGALFGRGSSAISRSQRRRRAERRIVLTLAALLLATACLTWVFGRDPAPQRTITTTKTVPSKHQTITTVDKGVAAAGWIRSEALSGGLLAVGLLLLVVSAFPDRETKLALPGGGEIGLGAATESAEAVATRLIRDAPAALRQDPEQFGFALSVALEQVLRESDTASQTASVLQPSDAELSAAVAKALHGIAAPPRDEHS